MYYEGHMSALSGKKVAVIGLGGMGLRHVDAYIAADATVVAGVDMRSETKDVLLQKSPTAHHYKDWRDMLTTEGLDMVSIVTNGPSHAEIVIAAATAGVPLIMCEKPMATSIVEARAMLEACAQHGSKLFVNFTLRAFPRFQELLRDLSNTVGEPRLMSVFIGGARGLGCVGSHYVDLMRLVFKSDAAHVSGTIDTTGTPNSRGAQFKDPGGLGIYHFENGARGILEMYEDYPLPPFVTISGTRSRITIDLAEEKLPSLTDGTQAMLEDAAGDGKFVSTGEDGLMALHMILGVHASDASQSTLPLPLSEKNYSLSVPMT